MRAVGENAHRQELFAAQDRNTLAHAADEINVLPQIRRALLDADDVLAGIDDLLDRFGQHIHARAVGDIIKNNGNIDDLVDALEIIENAALRGAEIIWRQNEQRVHADGLKRLADRHAFTVARLKNTGDHGNALFCRVDRDPHRLKALLTRQGRVLAGTSQHNDAANTGFDLELDMLAQRRFIDLKLCRQRCDERRHNSFEFHCLPSCVFSHFIFCIKPYRQISYKTILII